MICIFEKKTDMKINAPDHIITSILEALETNIMGKGIALRCEVTSKINGKSGHVEFIPKEGEVINPTDWFWLGFYVREYVDFE